MIANSDYIFSLEILRTNGIITKHFGRNVTKDVQIIFQNVLSRLVLLYDRKNPTLIVQDWEQIEAAQMKFLRSLEMVTCNYYSLTHSLTPWLMEPGGSMLHSQGPSNNPYPELNHPNSSY